MINRENRPITVLRYKDTLNEYGQSKCVVDKQINTQMCIHIYTQTNVTDPRYVDCDYVGITKNRDITVNDDILFGDICCNVMYIIPTRTYLIVLMKQK